MFGRCKPRAVRMRKGKTARKGEMQCVICYCAGYDGTKSLGETQQATWQARHLHGDVSRRLQRGTAPRSSPRREKGGRIYLPSGFPSPASHWSSFTPVGRTLPVLWGLSLSSSVARSVLWDVAFYPDLEAERGPVLVVCQPGETKTAAERPEQAPVGAILLRLQNTLKPVE